MIEEIKKSELVVKANLGEELDKILSDNPNLKDMGAEGAKTALKFAEQLSRHRPQEKEIPVTEVKTDVSPPSNTEENLKTNNYAKQGDHPQLVRFENGLINFAESHIDAFHPNMKAMAKSRGCKVN